MKTIAIMCALLASTLSSQQSTTPAAVPESPAAQSTANVQESTNPVLIHRVNPIYPENAKTSGVQGIVKIAFTIGSDGTVRDAKLLEGPQVFSGAALDAVQHWKYEPATKGGHPVEAKGETTFTFKFPLLWERKDPATSPEAGTGRPTRVRISQGVAEALLKSKVQPQYPSEARSLRIQGVVVLSAVIDYDGKLLSLGYVSGPQELVGATVKSVSQWQYKPYFLNGTPAQVETKITVNYELR
jgi:TonB family protein